MRAGNSLKNTFFKTEYVLKNALCAPKMDSILIHIQMVRITRDFGNLGNLMVTESINFYLEVSTAENSETECVMVKEYTYIQAGIFIPDHFLLDIEKAMVNIRMRKGAPMLVNGSVTRCMALGKQRTRPERFSSACGFTGMRTASAK